MTHKNIKKHTLMKILECTVMVSSKRTSVREGGFLGQASKAKRRLR
jgi:hypothetical protein